MSEREPAVLRDEPVAASGAPADKTDKAAAPARPALSPPARPSRREGTSVWVVGFWKRLAAAAIDLACVIPAALLAILIVSKIAGDIPITEPQPQTPPVPQPLTGAGTARITVILPSADTKLWIDDYLSQRTGVERTLITPELEPGGKYAYSITAMWTQDGQPVTRARDVTFEAGQNVVIDFTVPQPRRVDQE